MIFRPCHSEFQFVCLQTSSNRQAGTMRRTRCFEFVGASEIISRSNIDTFRWNKINADHDVVGEFAPKTRLALGIEIISVAPASQVFQRQRKAKGSVCHSLTETHLEVKRKMRLVVFIKRRQLRTDILCHKLLRRTSFAEPLCLQLFGISEHIYSALRLALNIVDNSSAEFRDALRNAIKPDDSDSNAIKGLKANLLERMA